MDPNAILALLGDLYTQLSRANAALDARNQQWSDPEALRQRVAEVEKAKLTDDEVHGPEAAPG